MRRQADKQTGQANRCMSPFNIVPVVGKLCGMLETAQKLQPGVNAANGHSFTHGPTRALLRFELNDRNDRIHADEEPQKQGVWNSGPICV